MQENENIEFGWQRNSDEDVNLSDVEQATVTASVFAGVLLSAAGTACLLASLNVPYSKLDNVAYGSASIIGAYIGGKVGFELVEMKRAFVMQIEALRSMYIDGK